MNAYTMKYSMLNHEMVIVQDDTGYEFRITEAGKLIYMNGESGDYSATRHCYMIPRYNVTKNGHELARLSSRLIPPHYGIDFHDGSKGTIRIGIFSRNGELTYKAQQRGRLVAKGFHWYLEIDAMDNEEDYLFMSGIVAMLNSRE